MESRVMNSKRVVFTNGCFDLLHVGHLHLLTQARQLGDRLVVGINSDASVRGLKGPGRPVLPQDAREALLRGLRPVDDVIVFDELTPERVIRELRPDVLVKGGDWSIDQIAGASFVKSYGGEVRVLPLVAGLSSTGLLERLRASVPTEGSARVLPTETHVAQFAAGVAEHLVTISALRASSLVDCRRTAERIGQRLLEGKKVLVAGNGGSAADAQHLAAELMVRFTAHRRPFPAVALTTDTSILTAHGNDFGFDDVFARQVEGLANSGDVFVAISTSGRSPNILNACRVARQRGCYIVGLTGSAGAELAALCDDTVQVPSTTTARVQEAHTLILHLWCEWVDHLTSTGGAPPTSTPGAGAR
jgi:D-sedoheptulose 7-phosphate isomerase